MTDLSAIERRQEDRKRGWEIAGEEPILNQTVTDIDTLLTELKRYREALEAVAEEGCTRCSACIANNALHPEKEEG